MKQRKTGWLAVMLLSVVAVTAFNFWRHSAPNMPPPCC
jgi:hypothetical protein